MKHHLPDDPECPRCQRPMVASYALGCLPGGESVKVPLGYACTNRDCVAAEQREHDERDRLVIQRAVQRGVIDP